MHDTDISDFPSGISIVIEPKQTVLTIADEQNEGWSGPDKQHKSFLK